VESLEVRLAQGEMHLSRQYTELERRDALDILAINQNNIALTSYQTGIPQRTLRDWQRVQYMEMAPPPLTPSAAAEQFKQRFPDKNDAVEYIVTQCLAELTAFADELPEIMRMAAPYHQVLTFIHIIDRLDKLRTLLPPQTFRVEHAGNDESVHDTPSYQHNTGNEPSPADDQSPS
jgi:hypothetical protein